LPLTAHPVNLRLYIAGRYLFSKKSSSAINIISAISVAGVAVVTAAMVIVLSVFNGFEGLVKSLYAVSDPPITITPALGKTMLPDTIAITGIAATEGVLEVVQVLEEGCLLRYRDRQYFARIKGVSESYPELTGIDRMMTDGNAALRISGIPRLLLGGGVAYHLEAGINDPVNPIEVYVPRKGVRGGISAEKSFKVQHAFPSGIFSVQQDFDLGYVLAPVDFVRSLIETDAAITSIEVFLNENANMTNVSKELEALLGPDFVVKDRFQQNELLYRIMKSEKWAVFLILAFILMISIFNVTGSLTMLIIDKRRDINILRSMGADEQLIKGIFLTEGLMITLAGALIGATAGLLVCWAQMTFGFIPLNTGGNYVVQTYPVEIQPLDTVYVLLTVLAIGTLAAWLPVAKVIRPANSLRMTRE
jgi:lipoprotein-releasing system permease protein